VLDVTLRTPEPSSYVAEAALPIEVPAAGTAANARPPLSSNALTTNNNIAARNQRTVEPKLALAVLALVLIPAPDNLKVKICWMKLK
jgi:hypothetical protein